VTVVDVHLFNIVLCALLKELSRDSSHVPELATVEEPKVSILFIPAFIFQLLKCLHYHLELFLLPLCNISDCLHCVYLLDCMTC